MYFQLMGKFREKCIKMKIYSLTPLNEVAAEPRNKFHLLVILDPNIQSRHLLRFEMYLTKTWD